MVDQIQVSSDLLPELAVQSLRAGATNINRSGIVVLSGDEVIGFIVPARASALVSEAAGLLVEQGAIDQHVLDELAGKISEVSGLIEGFVDFPLDSK